MGAPNVLVLDEPTNDFDVETLTALEDLLDGFAGTLIVVSHDRFFLERVCDDFVALLGDGHVRHLTGGVDDYLARRRVVEEAAVAAVAAPTPSAKSAAAQNRETQKSLTRLERQIDRLRDREEVLHADLAANSTDFETVTRLHEELRVVEAERASLEEQWLELAT
jgi:ATP-binding cassette subfamily F protein uup